MENRNHKWGDKAKFLSEEEDYENQVVILILAAVRNPIKSVSEINQQISYVATHIFNWLKPLKIWTLGKAHCLGSQSAVGYFLCHNYECVYVYVCVCVYGCVLSDKSVKLAEWR